MKWGIVLDSNEARDILTALEYTLKDENYNDTLLERLNVIYKELKSLVDH